MNAKDEPAEPGEGEVPLLKPSLTTGAPPPFHQLSEYTFQDLCREVVAEEPNVSTCNVYGTRGQKQHGIDILAQRSANDGIDVVQCKCYEQFPPAEIIAASEEFLAHWSTVWSHESVKRFILIVACDLIQPKRHAEILRQRKRFQEMGIQYEAWSAHDLQTRLRPHPSIVGRYLKSESEHWVKEICGPTALYTHWTAPVGSHVARGAAGDLIAALSATVGREIDHVRAHLREGRYDEAAKWLETGMPSDTLRALPTQVQARILRLRASITIELHTEVGRARSLSDDADRLDPEGAEGARLRAVLVLIEKGAEAALGALGTPVDIDGLNLRSALLIESGAADEAAAILSKLDDEKRANHESYRLQTYLALSRGDRDGADRFISLATGLAPQRESVRLMLASVRYAQALCTTTGEETFPWPLPIEWWQVRRDDQSRRLLNEAHSIVKELLGRFSLAGQPRRTLETWAVACLANDPDRQEEARELVGTVLRREPVHTRVIAWATARNIEVPPECRSALEGLVSAGKAEFHHVLALLSIHVNGGLLVEADRLHAATEDLFERSGAGEAWKRWRILLLLERGPSEALRVAIDEYEGPLAKDLQMMALDRKERATMAVRELGREGSISTQARLHSLFELCRAAAAGGEWSAIAKRADELVECVATPDAVQLAAISLFETRAFERCASLIQRCSALFPQSRLPVFLRQLLARCHAAIGGLRAATREATQVSQEQPTSGNLLALFEFHLRQGDLVSCAGVGRSLLGLPDLTLEQCLLLGRVVQVHDRPLATHFWRRSANTSVPDERVAAVLDLGQRLARTEDAPLVAALEARLAALGREGRAGVVVVDTEEQLLALLEAQHASRTETAHLYRRGEAPLHALLTRFNAGWAQFIHETASRNEGAPTFASRAALYLRHGARPRTIPLGAPALAERRLNLDITSLLVLEGLGLLERTFMAFQEVRVAQETIPLLVTERTTTQGARSEWLGTLVDKLRTLVHEDRLTIMPMRSPERGGAEGTNTFAQASLDSLTSLLAVTPERHDVICIDDRFLSRHSSHQGVTVLGVLELLDALRGAGHLSDEERLGAISRLRSWNARHLALEEEELLLLIERTNVVHGAVVESVELRVLRSYVAASLLDGESLQFPPMPPGSPNPTGEFEYVMSLLRATQGVLLTLFEPGREHALERANWIFRWLQPNLLLMTHPSGANRNGQADPDDLTVVSLAHLVTLPLRDTITIELALAEPRPQTTGFVRWLNGVLEDYFSAQPALRRRVWEAVRSIIGAALTHDEGQEPRLASMLLARAFMRSLPPALDELAVRDVDFLARHGLEITRTVTVDDVSFTNESFHTAVKEAVNGRPSRARLAGEQPTDVEFVVRMVNGSPELVFTPPGATDPITSRDPAFGAISDDAVVRARSFGELRGALGSSAESFSQIERQLLALGPAARMDHYHDLWRRSGKVFYGGLRGRCEQHDEIAYREMRPADARQMLTYFGLEAESHDLDRTARLLIERCGIQGAIVRMSGLPCALPAPLRAAFRALEVDERARTLAGLRRSAVTVLDGIRLLELATVGDLIGHPDHNDLGPAVLERLLGEDGLQQFETLEALLLWTNSDFLRWAETNDWPPPVRLCAVWMHSHQLLRIFSGAGVDVVMFARMTRRATTTAPAEVFGQDRLYRRDVAHPRGVQWQTFLAAALEMAVRESSVAWWAPFIDRIHAALTIERNDGRRSLHPHFMLDTSLAADHIGSFLRAEWDAVLGRLLAVDDQETRAGLAPATLRAGQQGAVSTLEQTPGDAKAWTVLYGMCLDYGFDESLAPRLVDILVRVDLVSLCAEPSGYRIPLAVMQNFVASSQDRRVAIALESQLIALAQRVVDGVRTRAEVRQDAGAILDAAYTISAAEPNTAHAIEAFVRVIDRLADVDPSLLDTVSPLVQQLWRWLPGQELVCLAPLYLRLRRDARWGGPAAAEHAGVEEADEGSDDEQV